MMGKNQYVLLMLYADFMSVNVAKTVVFASAKSSAPPSLPD